MNLQFVSQSKSVARAGLPWLAELFLDSGLHRRGPLLYEWVSAFLIHSALCFFAPSSHLLI